MYTYFLIGSMGAIVSVLLTLIYFCDICSVCVCMCVHDCVQVCMCMYVLVYRGQRLTLGVFLRFYLHIKT